MKLLVLLGLTFAVTAAESPAPTREPLVHTFSIVAYDPATDSIGVAVQSKYFGVGSVVPWAKAGVGAVATQSYARMVYGPEGLDRMAAGEPPEQALAALTAADPRREVRQVAMVDARGRASAFTGKECVAWAGHKTGKHYSVQGNLLVGEAVITSMSEAFEKARQQPDTELSDWLVAALVAGQQAGGDKRGQQSAALLVVRAGAGPGGDNDRFVDLRVEDHPEPIKELDRLLSLHKRFYHRIPAK